MIAGILAALSVALLRASAGCGFGGGDGMHRRKALLDYTGDRTAAPSVAAGSVRQVHAMAASPVVRAGRRTPGGVAPLYHRIPFRGQEAAKGPLEPFRTERRLESTVAEADAWVGRRVRTRSLHLLILYAQVPMKI